MEKKNILLAWNRTLYLLHLKMATKSTVNGKTNINLSSFDRKNYFKLFSNLDQIQLDNQTEAKLLNVETKLKIVSSKAMLNAG